MMHRIVVLGPGYAGCLRRRDPDPLTVPDGHRDHRGQRRAISPSVHRALSDDPQR
jgi:hypothetical protein